MYCEYTVITTKHFPGLYAATSKTLLCQILIKYLLLYNRLILFNYVMAAGAGTPYQINLMFNTK